MKILTNQSLNEAIKLCQENDRYRVLIVTQCAKDRLLILDELSQHGADVARCMGHPWAKFPNGSVIDMVSMVTNMCGRRANLVLCQAEVYNDCEEIRYTLQAIEMTNRSFKFFDNKE